MAGARLPHRGDLHDRREDEREEEQQPERLHQRPDEAEQRPGVAALEVPLHELPQEKEMAPHYIDDVDRVPGPPYYQLSSIPYGSLT